MNENDFAQKIGQIKNRLYRTAYMYLGSESEAIDAVDEAVYKALISLKKLRQPDFFSTWITRILINECKSEIKRRKRTVPIEEIPDVAEDQLDSMTLRQAVLSLPRELKEPIILHYFGGLTIAETAEALSIPQGTAATRTRRAIKLLRLEFLQEEYIDG